LDRRLNPGGAPRSGPPPSADSLTFLERYAPMQRLLSEVDAQFLERHVHGSPAFGERIRVEHRAIYLAYIRELRSDVRALRREQRANIARGLWRDQPRFEKEEMLFRYHFLRLYAAALLHAVHSPFAARMAVSSLDAIERLVEPPLSAAAAGA